MTSPASTLSVSPVAPAVTPDNDGYFDRIRERVHPDAILPYKTVAGRTLTLHRFDPATSGSPNKADAMPVKRPAILFIHGGGWTGNGPGVVYPWLEYFAKLGLVAFGLEYRLSRPRSPDERARGENEFAAILDCVRDARSAMRHLRLHAGDYGIDPHKIIAAGGSAGAHLAACTTLFTTNLALYDEPGESVEESPAANALILHYPVIDTSPAGYGCERIGPRWRELSPLHAVRPGLPPTLLFHGTGDTTTPVVGAEQFAAAMRAAGNRCEYHPAPGAGHGYLRQQRGYFEDAQTIQTAFIDSLCWLGEREL
ncbi:alpha/beta hydrolase [Geminisphaera colitermitum]|uniref:alpha/beta hydrolase n=1 Tax=Geminisphaera colitermitum TaxID=1148786 RepID=UPI000158C9AD|nr:alpha/beta hydrolase [Geminisphaera colitermitum]